MTWLREMVRAIADALIAHWRAPRQTRVLGGDAALDRKVAEHIRLRSRETYGASKGRQP